MADEQRRAARLRRGWNDDHIPQAKLGSQLLLQNNAVANAFANTELDDALIAGCGQNSVYLDPPDPEKLRNPLLRQPLHVIVPGCPSLELILGKAPRPARFALG